MSALDKSTADKQDLENSCATRTRSLPCRCKEHNNRQLLHQILKNHKLGHNDYFLKALQISK